MRLIALFLPGMMIVFLMVSKWVCLPNLGFAYQLRQSSCKDWFISLVNSNLPSGELTFCHGKSPFLIGKPSINGPFLSISIAMLVHQRVCTLYFWICTGFLGFAWVSCDPKVVLSWKTRRCAHLARWDGLQAPQSPILVQKDQFMSILPLALVKKYVQKL